MHLDQKYLHFKIKSLPGTDYFLINLKNLVVAHSLGGRVGMGGGGAMGGAREGGVGKSREGGDNVWLWLEGREGLRALGRKERGWWCL